MFGKCSTILLLVLGVIASAVAEVIVVSSTNPIYVRSPRLRIRGTGFEDAKDDIVLELGVSGQPLRGDVDYSLSKDGDGDGVVLKLISNRTWANIADLTPPVPLTLTSIKFGASAKNLLLAPVVVATVLPVPSIKAGEKNMKATDPVLKINGTGLIGAKKADLYFQPSLIAGTHYEDVSTYPLTSNLITLNLKEGYKWRNESGALTVMGVDTGASFVKLNGGLGVVVANIGSSSSAAAAAPTVEFIDIPSDKEKTKSTSSTKSATSDSATAAPKKESGVMKLVDAFSSAFGGKSSSADSASATTSTTSSTPTTAKATSAVQFVDIPTLAAGAATTPKASTATDGETKSTKSKSTASDVQFVDMTTTAAPASSTGSSKSSAAFSLAEHVASVGAAKSADAVFADTIAILQKKIVKYTKLLDAADSVEESVKIADLLVKLSTTLNNIN